MPALEILPIPGVGEIVPGDDLTNATLTALAARGMAFRSGDILVVTQKIVSKAEGRLVALGDVVPSALAVEWASRWGKDPRATEVVLRESRRIVRMDRGVIISETQHGFICANAGVDASNMRAGTDEVALLPVDPDASAERLRIEIAARTDAEVGVVISDTFGRPWREGQTNVAIGVAGLRPFQSFEGQRDPAGYELRVTALAVADEIAGAAELVMGKLDRVPLALVRGLAHLLGPGSGRDLVRPAAMDMFR